jgi:hypothetical protein
LRSIDRSAKAASKHHRIGSRIVDSLTIFHIFRFLEWLLSPWREVACSLFSSTRRSVCESQDNLLKSFELIFQRKRIFRPRKSDFVPRLRNFEQNLLHHGVRRSVLTEEAPMDLVVPYFISSIFRIHRRKSISSSAFQLVLMRSSALTEPRTGSSKFEGSKFLQF